MKKAAFVAALFFSVSAVSAQQMIVVPAVSDNVSGQYGSVWSTELSIVKKDPGEEVTVHRLWVCVPEGGFAEIPGDGLSWDMTEAGEQSHVLQLFGADLLAGSDSRLGAVGLQVEGGEVVANAKIVDISNGTVWGGTPFGQGQRITTGGDPLVGPALIPWIGGCLNSPCDSYQRWSFLRNNVGLVNPNPNPLTVSGELRAFGNNVAPDSGHYQTGEPVELFVWGGSTVGSPESFEIDLPAYGWRQFTWHSSSPYVWGYWAERRIPNIGFMVELTPDSGQLPYHAYASVVFVPDPASGVSPFNDPMFIPAEPVSLTPGKQASTRP